VAGWSGDTVADGDVNTERGRQGVDVSAVIRRRRRIGGGRSRTAATAIEAAVRVCTAGLWGCGAVVGPNGRREVR
jgi:hypothetical protein